MALEGLSGLFWGLWALTIVSLFHMIMILKGERREQINMSANVVKLVMKAYYVLILIVVGMEVKGVLL